MSVLGRRLFNDPNVGAFNHRPPCDLQDSSDTSLPTGANPMIDGVTVANSMRVLFTNLASGNNMVYKATNVNDPINGVQWILEIDGPSTNGMPEVGDLLFIEEGSSYEDSFLGWDGSGSFVSVDAMALGRVEVSNSVSSSGGGTVVKKSEIYDTNGDSLGYLYIYNS